VDLWCIKC